MKETDFIRHNKKKWAKDEIIFDKKNADPDLVSEAFTEITEDLSYARTFYTFRSVRVYLNQLAQSIYFKLNLRKVSFKNLIRFWTDEVPQAMVESRKDMNLAMTIFFFGILIGVVSTVYDPDFPRIILGDQYVNMTLENINNGDPMKVYKDAAPFDMFFAITFNNLMVAYRVFVMGILF
ncbi:MAG TPA: stage II sporulation protein M, partial [Bacteroidetes bacterium]|nr:stage II sporulation protein M [Bacteroidota bacterium]